MDEDHDTGLKYKMDLW